MIMNYINEIDTLNAIEISNKYGVDDEAKKLIVSGYLNCAEEKNKIINQLKGEIEILKKSRNSNYEIDYINNGFAMYIHPACIMFILSICANYLVTRSLVSNVNFAGLIFVQISGWIILGLMLYMIYKAITGTPIIKFLASISKIKSLNKFVTVQIKVDSNVVNINSKEEIEIYLNSSRAELETNNVTLRYYKKPFKKLPYYLLLK